MGNTHTAALLSLLSKSELTLLGKFLKSPFFTAKKHLFDLFLELRKNEQLTLQSPREVFAKVFDGQPFDSHKWNKTLSDLNSCIRDFLAVRQLSTDPHLRTQADMNAFFDRPDGRFFQHTASAELRRLPGDGIPETSDGWQLRFWALKLSFSHPFADPTKVANKLLGDLDDSIDLYYFISKLQVACNRASSAQVLSIENDQTIFQQLLKQTERLDRSGKSALLTLYRGLLNLFTTPGAQFEPFFALLQRQAPRLERSELEFVARFALNYCIHRYSAGKAEAFEWYRRVFGWADQQKVWVAAAGVEDFFINDGVMFAKSGDAKGFEAFLEKGKKTLPNKQRNNALALLQAYWHFYQAEFQDAAALLNRLGSRHPRHSLRYHSLNMRNMYEEWRRKQVEFDALEQVTRRFKDFLKRNALFSKSKRQSYLDLIWFVQKMMRYGEKRALSKKQLLTELEKKQPVAIDWIVIKINELP